MLRPPLAALTSRPIESLCLVLLLACALTLPAAVGMGAMMTQTSAQAWLERYEPTLYLDAHASAEDARVLQKELMAWSSVGSAQLRSPEGAVETLRKRLGPEAVQHLGIGPAMMPTSITLKPNVALKDHVGLIGAVQGLEARDIVASVDVPSAQSTKMLHAAHAVAWAALVCMLVLWVLSLGLLWSFLRRVLKDEHQEMALLEQFGASGFSLVRAHWIRGAVMGGIGGVVACTALLCVQFSGQSFAQAMTQQTWGVSWSWALAIAPLLLGPLQGFIAGHAVALGTRRRKAAYVQTTPLMRFGAATA